MFAEFFVFFVYVGGFLLLIGIGSFLFKLGLWPVYKLTGGKLSFLDWWRAWKL